MSTLKVASHKALLDLAPTVLGSILKKATNYACGNRIALKVLNYRENYELGLSRCAISLSRFLKSLAK